MQHAVLTGPIKGTVTLPDGRQIDVSDDVILLDTIEDAQAVADAIGARHAADGHPDHLGSGVPFEHRSFQDVAQAVQAAQAPTTAEVIQTDTPEGQSA
jgi:hypothetical protein